MRLVTFLASVLVCASSAMADELSQAMTLGVKQLSLQELEVARDGKGRAMVSLRLDGREVLLDLEPYSVRSDEFRLVLDLGGGVLEEVPAPAPKTVRGSVVGEPGSVASGSLTADGLTLMIALDDELWSVQPVEGEGDGVHAIYRGEDVLDHGGTCEVPNADAPPAPPAFPARRTERSEAGTRGAGDFRIAEIAIDADWHLYNNYFGQNQNALLNDIDSVMAGLNTIYERDTLLTHTLTQVIIRTSSGSNPYTTNDASSLLGQFQTHWNTNHGDVQRDVAHLWTGRNMSGSTIGIAYLSVICTSSAYGVDQIRFSSNYNSRVALFAHELGHNWSAGHCDGQGECRIMCSGLGGCNGLGNPVRFGPVSENQILSYIPGRSCVDNIGIDLPLFENFDNGSLDPISWGTALGFDIPFDGSAPSGSRVGRLSPPFALLTTTPISMNIAPGNTVAVKIWLEPESSTSEAFRVDVRDAQNTQVRIGMIPGDEQGGQYRQYIMQLPGVALNIDTTITFSPSPSGPAWRFDNIEIVEVASTSATIDLPLVEDFERAGLFMDRWQPSPAFVNNAEPGVPSGIYSVALEAGQRMETADVLAQGQSDIVFGVLVSSPSDAPGDAELVFEYRDSSGVWHEAGRFPASSLPSADFGVAEVILPADAGHDGLSVAIHAVGAASTDAWRLDDLEIGGEPRSEDCIADMNGDGILDLQDISAFVAAFSSGDLAADLAAPFGVLDLQDISAFSAAFLAGCP